MNAKRILTIIGLTLVALILLTVAVLCIGDLDLISYTATGSETLVPAGMSMGHALVVYDPGMTGVAKSAAVKVAENLKLNGYTVTLAGVRSTVAENASEYDVIAIGGPVYFGDMSRSTGSYLKLLTPQKGVKLGIFATGSDQSYKSDLEYVRNGTASAWCDSHPDVKPVINVFGQSNVDPGCRDFVSALLQQDNSS